MDDDDDDDDDDRSPEDPRKQYVAVQQGHDIPLKGLRKPAPQPNVYRGKLLSPKRPADPPHAAPSHLVSHSHSLNHRLTLTSHLVSLSLSLSCADVSLARARLLAPLSPQSTCLFACSFVRPPWLAVGPAPPPFALELALEPESAELVREQYRRHNLRLAQSLGRRAKLGPAEAAHTRQVIESWQEDLYTDFERLYTSLCAQRAPEPPPPSLTLSPAPPNGYSAEQVSFETRALAESLADVEEALRKVAGGGGGTRAGAPSPSPSIAGSERTLADSRNTSHSLVTNGGPALVEEMTLSDLEDEICSTLMAARDAERQRRYQEMLKLSAPSPDGQARLLQQAGQHLLNGRRSRQPLSSGLALALAAQQSRRPL